MNISQLAQEIFGVKIILKALLVVLTILAPPLVFAWSGFATGTITVIKVTAANNYAFRVTLGGQAMCGNSNSRAYINNSDPNYNVYVAMLLSAKAQGTVVSVYSNAVSLGYCQIGYMVSY